VEQHLARLGHEQHAFGFAVGPTPTGPFVPATPISTSTNVDTGIVSSTFPAPAPAGFFIPARLE